MFGYLGALSAPPDQARVDALRLQLAALIAQVKREIPPGRAYDTKKLIAVYDALAKARMVVGQLLNDFIQPSAYARHEERQAAWRYLRDLYQASFEKMRPYRDVIVAARAVMAGEVAALPEGTQARANADAMAKSGGAPSTLLFPGDGFGAAVVAELAAADAVLGNTEAIRWMYGTGSAGNWIDDLGVIVTNLAELVADLARAVADAAGMLIGIARWAARNWMLVALGAGGLWYYKNQHSSRA